MPKTWKDNNGNVYRQDDGSDDIGIAVWKCILVVVAVFVILSITTR